MLGIVALLAVYIVVIVAFALFEIRQQGEVSAATKILFAGAVIGTALFVLRSCEP